MTEKPTSGPKDALAERREAWRQRTEAGGAANDPWARGQKQATRPRLPAKGWQVALAWSALTLERFLAAGWPLLALICVFFTLVFFGVPSTGGVWPHLLLLLVTVGLLYPTLRHLVRRFDWPDLAASLRRIERDTELQHRPLEALRDRPATGDEADNALWKLHQQRQRERLGRLRVDAPDPGLAGRDRYGLRYALPMLLLVSILTAWGQWSNRLIGGLVPGFSMVAGSGPPLDLWIAPPDYTGRAPIFLASGDGTGLADGSTLSVPEGSIILGRFGGSSWTPKLIVNDEATAFTAIDGGYELETPLTEGGELVLRHALTERGSWQIGITADSAPDIAFAETPEGTERATLKLAYEANDDYGLTALRGQITLAAVVSEAAERPAIMLELPLAGDSPRSVDHSSYHDLTAHVWAGLPVRITLFAEDAKGQLGRSESVEIVLPERDFTHPVAIAVIEQRRQLAIRPDELRGGVARTLKRLAEYRDAYQGDIVAYLSLHAAAARLAASDALENLPDIEELLWDTALHIEDGGISTAQDRVRAVQQTLMEALEDETVSNREIQELLSELQRETQALMQALAQRMQQLQEQGMEFPDIPPEMLQQMMEAGQMQEMLDRLRDMSDIGAREAARQMLSELQEMLENFDAGQLQPMTEAMQAMMEIMQDLDRITQEQEALLDETYARTREQAAQQPPQGDPDQRPSPFDQRLFDNWPSLNLPMPSLPQPGPTSPRAEAPQTLTPPQPGEQSPEEGDSRSFDALGQEQDALRRELGDVMRRLGEYSPEIPGNLAQAEQAMRRAGRGFDETDGEAAMVGQRLALEQLRQGSDQMQQQMFGGQTPMLFSFGAPRRAPGYREGEDPLGNRLPNNRGFSSDQVEIPDEDETQRLQRILEELRDRAGDFDRSEEERDYIERLLEQF